MKLSFGKFIILAIAGTLLIHFCYDFYNDAVYFLTKRESTAKMIKLTRLGYDSHIQLEFKYYNTFVKKDTVGLVTLKPMPFSIFNKPNQKYTIFYGRNDATNVFLNGNGAPRVTVLLSDVLMIVLMLAAIYLNLDFKRAQFG